MQNQKLLDDYARNLGKVVGNLHSLEIMLRLFLHKVELNRYGATPPEVSLDNIKAGNVLPENYLTNWDSLGDLVKKYNDSVTYRGVLELCVDEIVVKLRDTFAHGRVLGKQPEPPFQIYKFEKPTGTHEVRVEYVANLTEKELAVYIHHVREQIEKVEKACKLYCPEIIG